jgi:hypothetical protein
MGISNPGDIAGSNPRSRTILRVYFALLHVWRSFCGLKSGQKSLFEINSWRWRAARLARPETLKSNAQTSGGDLSKIEIKELHFRRCLDLWSILASPSDSNLPISTIATDQIYTRARSEICPHHRNPRLLCIRTDF